MEAPKAIQNTFEALKTEYQNGLILKRINDKFYVYKEHGEWNKELKKSKTIFEYLGKITSDGVFKRKNMSDLETAKLVVHAYGGKVILPEKMEEPNNLVISANDEEKQLLTILSMNGRASLDLIHRLTGLPKKRIPTIIKRIEKRYNIRYLAELDVSKLGYLSYLAFIKFFDKIPTQKEINALLENDPHIQLVALTSGEYDMVIFFLSNSNKEVAYFIFNLKISNILAPYAADWYVTPLYSARARFMPIREQFFDLLKEKIWHRTKEKPRPESNNILDREYNVLKELNHNGSIDFTDIDEKYGFARGTARYTYYKLKERGILTGITITLQNLPIKSNALFIINSFYGKDFIKSRPILLSEIITDGPIINKYSFSSDIGVPSGAMIVMPVFKDSQIKETEDFVANKIKGTNLKKLMLTNIPIGSFANRRYDKMYTNQYRLLIEEYGLIKATNKQNYEETNKRNRQERTYSDVFDGT